ncbi:2,3-bisphosphoglycerate-dependent phosphoglycerate mutase [Gammaproteobacteria bacterium]|jgi:2,3-bisphosphoglycerate-dependent phosphoglycerate mutase|nr:2,3-bisphosphoglycerate-dependent phosphoglycerate mutase [Gammaproteobacteria bacterium]MDC1099686.1 2,3-bisphosphoglycerate-dependent phosphoglycerate mutase [Gammaproteobacteria bacterium]MDC1149177.1 2,3-bisphosphoglycerate-dependent phosphoglycerate mutase [Gammaproteobacteria bacterium]MDC1170720.1 2,3-bisphosphoglycerate-dependent phosphoglycerate mutase [Gammaproteobacteria bacterium]MDC3313116.1 2,3-bisphosphoglycerate-dependent phosphoglycerate mutase [Gammaproteobacteria bacterium|tara:strand:- start:1004 stop:1630 length:627 start_codon:yes stop_codon:yes gene_type:complete
MKTRNLILVRHGQSEWNEQNLFTGWKDPGLTELGIKEAKNAGSLISDKGIQFDEMFTSMLVRAQDTGAIILDSINQQNIPITKNKALNERNYGSLAGLNKDDARKKWGEEQVHIWRRSFDIPPPEGESLKDTAERVLPYFHEYIMPKVIQGLSILVAAHGNSLRALIMELDLISSEDIVKLEIPTGAPIQYEFNQNGEVVNKTKLYEE